MRDDALLALVDANLVAFGRHLAATAALPGSERPAAAAVLGHRGRPYGVWTRAHADAALEAVLPLAGFRVVLDLPVMILDVPPEGRAPSAEGVIREVVDARGVADFRAAARGGFADDPAALAAVDVAFRVPASLIGPEVAGFVAYVGGAPVGCAMSFTAGDVTRIDWVATVPAIRRRGLGGAVTRAATNAGFERGAHLATLEASPAGESMYRALGFREASRFRIWTIA